MIFEGIENSDIYTAAENKPYALKKYIAKRLTGAGIPLDQEKTFKERGYGRDAELDNDLYKGMRFDTQLEIPTELKDDGGIYKSNIFILLNLKGRTLTITYRASNKDVKVKFDISHSSTNDVIKKIIKGFKPAKEKLIEIHSQNREHKKNAPEVYSSRGYGKQRASKEHVKGIEIAKKANIPGINVEFVVGDVKSFSGRQEASEFRFTIKDDIEIDMSRRRKGDLLVRMFKDPTIKRMMEKDDKVAKDMTWNSATHGAFTLIASSKQVQKGLLNLYDYIKNNTDYIIVGGSGGTANSYEYGSKYPHIAVREPNWDGFDAKAEKNKRQNSKQHAKRSKIVMDIIENAKNRKRYADSEMERYEKKAAKYSHLLLKRFFANPEKYI